MYEIIAAELGAPFEAVPWPAVLVRMTAAVVLGGLIGLERELHSRPAGMRTHMLVSLAAALFAILTFELLEEDMAINPASRADPLRLIEAVTAGVAFLAAGSIIISGGNVRGLTTGAGLWLAGAVGLACGVGRVPLGAIATLFAILILWAMRRLAEAVKSDADEDAPAATGDTREPPG